MKILILGGIAEAVLLAKRLSTTQHRLVYSLAGLGRPPELNCPIRTGIFANTQALSHFLIDGQFNLLIDCTHPYAINISQQAYQASQQSHVNLWVYRRPAWQACPTDHWQLTANWSATWPLLAPYYRPLLTIGRSPIHDLSQIQAHQTWFIRCLPQTNLPHHARVHWLLTRGPFHLDDEITLMKQQKIDALVCKNSGGDAVQNKLGAARQLNIPVFMLVRPQLPECNPTFNDIQILFDALLLQTNANH